MILMKSNRLVLSVSKTNFVPFYSKKLKSYKTLNLIIDGVYIQEVSTVKYLGLTNLPWKNLVNELCLKLWGTLGIFSKLRYFVNVDSLIMYNYALICPFLTYRIPAWGLTYATYLKPVITLQKRVIRIMIFSDSRSLLKSLRLLKFSNIIHLEILSFVYYWNHKLSPSSFVNYFNPVSSIHTYNTRRSQIENLFVTSVHNSQ